MENTFVCYDCQRVTSGNCGKHGPAIITYGHAEPERQREPSPEAVSAAALLEGPLYEYCPHDSPPAYMRKYECFPADWTGRPHESCFVQVMAAALDAAREQGRRETQAHIDYLHSEHGYCAFPGCLFS